MHERHHPLLLRPDPLALKMESSKFSPTLLPEMKTYDVKNSYCPKPTRVDYGTEEFVNSLKNYWSWQIPILYSQSLQFFVEVSI
jgi:hypothetical protein